MSNTRVSVIECSVARNHNTIVATLKPAQDIIAPQVRQQFVSLVRQVMESSPSFDDAQVSGPLPNAHATMTLRFTSKTNADECEKNFLSELRRAAPANVQITESQPHQSQVI